MYTTKPETRIEDVTLNNLNDLITLCVPDEKSPSLMKGIQMKKRWAAKMVEMYGTFAWLAYVNSRPAGMTQIAPNIDEETVEIQCIFVPDEQNHKKGIGSGLLKAVIQDMENPKPYFNDRTPRALVTYAFEVPGRYPQHKFYLKMGFEKVADNPYLLYYPLQEGYVCTRKEEFIPQKEDEGKALIFYDPSCPFCVSFNEKIMESIREIADIPMRVINRFEDSEEVRKRGNVPLLVVNRNPIKSFVSDPAFKSEVSRALSD